MPQKLNSLNQHGNLSTHADEIRKNNNLFSVSIMFRTLDCICMYSISILTINMHKRYDNIHVINSIMISFYKILIIMNTK